MTEPSRAVFLSYASQDAPAAESICGALRAAGIEVWFDQSELRGGDAWDQKIRREIRDCALFIPIVSRHTQERLEGYFRREWKLAVERTHDMAEQKAFLLPVVVDSTGDRDAVVPDLFRAVQWTRLPGGDTPPGFVDRVQRLLSSEASSRAPGSPVPGAATKGTRQVAARPWSKRFLPAAAAAVILAAVAYLAIDKLWISKPAVSAPPVVASGAPAAFSPPLHSIAVLPFANLSGDKEQQYFSDGLTEELLNSLADINELHVAARTSSFSFQGEHPDIATVAHKLNVASVLEGSVRRSGHTIRITAQLIDAVTGFHLWSKTYDRDVGDVLKVQTEIATAVAGALKVTLLGDEAAKMELGGTHNPAAFDAYLRAAKAVQSRRDAARDIPAAIAAYTEALRLDPNYALALAGRSSALSTFAGVAATGAGVREDFEKAESDARRAIALAPELPQAHLALAGVLEGAADFAGAGEEYQRALALGPGNAQVLRGSSRFAALTGHFDVAIAAARRAVVLDPLDHRSYGAVGRALYFARQYGESITAFAAGIRLNPDFQSNYGQSGLSFYGLGDLASARASCETKPDYWLSQQCLALVYEKLGRHADAQAELEKMQVTMGGAAAYQYATIYAQWGDRAKALEWLDTAVRLRDPGLGTLKTDPLLDPLRTEPRFQAVIRELKFPG